MIENFEKAFKLLMKLEGYASNLPGDPGGDTILGVTSKFYPDVYAELKSALTPDKTIPIAKNFYYKEFWLRYNCDMLPDKIDILYFVTAVNTPRGMKSAQITGVGSLREEAFEVIDYYVRNSKIFPYGLVKRILRVDEYLRTGTFTI